jgi:hypothetical protein
VLCHGSKEGGDISVVLCLYMVGLLVLGTMRRRASDGDVAKEPGKHGLPLRILRSFRARCTNGVRSFKFDSALRRTAFLRRLAVAGGRVDRKSVLIVIVYIGSSESIAARNRTVSSIVDSESLWALRPHLIIACGTYGT